MQQQRMMMSNREMLIYMPVKVVFFRAWYVQCGDMTGAIPGPIDSNSDIIVSGWVVLTWWCSRLWHSEMAFTEWHAFSLWWKQLRLKRKYSAWWQWFWSWWTWGGRGMPRALEVAERKHYLLCQLAAWELLADKRLIQVVQNQPSHSKLPKSPYCDWPW